MKKLLLIILAAITFIAPFSCKKDKKEKTLVSIAVSVQPTKKTYTVGDVFDMTGMTVTATYSDGSTAPVTVTAAMLSYDFNTAGTDKTVIITYSENGQTVTATVEDITVTAPLTYVINLLTSVFEFGSAAAGYPQQTAQTVTIINSGTGAVTLTQPTATAYDIGTLSASTLAAGAQATFTVCPKTGLSVGIYYEAIAISGSNGVSISIGARFEVVEGTGEGSEGNPFKVANLADLQKVGSGTDGWTRSAHYIQTGNIDLNGVAWTPIGGSNFFNGSYDGGGYTISNLTINNGSMDNVGLFGLIGTTGAVKNLILTNVDITAQNNVGGVAGQNAGTIEYCHVQVAGITGNYGIGGVAGYNYNGTISKCFVTGGAVAANDSYYAGGVAGGNGEEGTVENCYATVNVSGGGAGGVVGTNVGIIRNCYATGNVSTIGASSSLQRTGGVVGYNGVTVENCVALNKSVTTTSVSTDYIGRVAGQGGRANNYGRTDMVLTANGVSVTVTSAAIHGADVTSTEYGSSGWWMSTSTWSSGGAWDFLSVWQWNESTSLPVLRGINGAQNHTVTP